MNVRAAFAPTFPSKNKIHDRRLRGNVASVAYALRVCGGQYDPKGGDYPPQSASGLLLPLIFRPEAERDGDDWRLFGYCHIFEWEWGYLMLSKLESLRLPFGMTVERDLYTFGKIVRDFLTDYE